MLSSTANSAFFCKSRALQMEQHGRLKVIRSELHVYLEADDVCLMVVKETTKAPVLQDKVPYGWDLHAKSCF